MSKLFQSSNSIINTINEQTEAKKTVYPILLAISFGHLCNDLIQAIVPAAYPMLKENYDLTFAQIGMITFCYQLSSSLLQPLVGTYTDKHPQPYSQIFGMICSMLGVVTLSFAPSYFVVLLSVTLIGIGSSIFHPESSRVSYVASGGKRSLAQSIFQIGGNTGTALAPLLVAWIVLPNGQQYMLWFLLIGVLAQLFYLFIGTWYKGVLAHQANKLKKVVRVPQLSKARVNFSIVLLLLLIFSKYFYVASISSYFQFYMIDRFGLSEVQAQVYLFYFLVAIAAGTLIGGFFGDKVGRKYIIWFSVLGVAPFTILLPYAPLEWISILIVVIGLILSSAFPSILVYAQELLPRKIGMVSGLFFGFAFGMGGLGSAILGWLADRTSIEFIYNVCAYLPLIGIIAAFLPNMRKVKFIEE
ncbi:MFS transporter [Myroides pelagicus]|uniref:MFS transporter n=1 Tax=Myroides pelagicus TaxID=270914 RepID=A0A7K1GN33_9FLAO|nr:MFS transporter [Myroides pelagicus]MEC4113148.1 MFS transporter [Myroides pelagicus]MTH29803.1 MFS transporter [Myroides pelagicus]